MADTDFLGIGIKTILEVDEKTSKQNINKFVTGLNGNKNSGNADVKLIVGVAKERSRANITSFINELKASNESKIMKIGLDVDRTQSVANIQKALGDIEKKLKDTTVKINVEVGDFVEAVKKAGKKESLSGVSWTNITGGKKFKQALEAEIDNYTKNFKDAGAKLSSTSITYDPAKKQYSAIVQYKNEVGKTTSMLFTLDEATEKIRVTQTRLTNNVAQQNKELEKSKTFLTQQENAYKNLYSKAYNQKNPLSGNYKDTADAALSAYKAQIDIIVASGEKVTAEQRRNLEALREDAKRIITEQKDAQYGATDLASKDITSARKTSESNINARINELKQMGVYVNEVETNFENLRNTIGSVGDMDGLQKWQAQLREAEASLRQFLSTAAGQGQVLANTINGKQLQSIGKMLGFEGLQQNTSGIQAVKNELLSLKTEYENLVQSFAGKDLSDTELLDLSNRLGELDKRLKSVTSAAKIFDGTIGSTKNLEKASQRVEKLKADYANMKNEWSAAAQVPELAQEMREFEASLSGLDVVNVDQMQKSFATLKGNIREAGMNCKTFVGQMRDLVKHFTSLITVGQIIALLRRGFVDIVQNIKAVNSAMIELVKVTDMAEAQQRSFVNNAAEVAKTIGTSVTDYISSTADFARLGFGLADAEAMAQAANIYYVVGDEIGSIEEATQSLVSVTQAYGYAASDVLLIVDKLNAAGNAMAISSGGIGAALQRSAAALEAGGNTLDESIALIAAANRVAQNPEVVGNMWKTVSMRIRSTRTELEEAGEDTEGMLETTAELRDLVMSITGFDIMEDDGTTFKSTYDIVLGIAKVWGELENDMEKSALLEALAGKRQGNILAGALNNVKDLEKALGVSEGAAGSAMQEHSRWMESIEASEKAATAAFEEFSNKIMSSGLVKLYYDLKGDFLSFLSTSIDKAGSLSVILGGLSTFLSFKKAAPFSILSGNGKGFFNKVGLFGTSFTSLFSTSQKQRDQSFLDAFVNNRMSGTDNASAIQKTLQQLGHTSNDISSSALKAARAYDGLGGSLKAVGASAKLASVGMSLLNAGINLAVSFGISLAIKAIDNWIHKQDILEEKLAESKNAYQESAQNLETLESKLAETSSLIDEMSGKQLNIVEQEELDQLERENALLREQIRLEKEKVATREQAAKEQLVETVGNKLSSGTMWTVSDTQFKYLVDSSELETAYRDDGTLSDFEKSVLRNSVVNRYSAEYEGRGYEQAYRATMDALRAASEDENKYWDEYIRLTEEGNKEEAQIAHDMWITANADRKNLSADLLAFTDYFSETFEDYGRIENPVEAWEHEYNRQYDLWQEGEALFGSVSGNARRNAFEQIARTYEEDFDRIERAVQTGTLTAENFASSFPDVVKAFESIGWSMQDVLDFLYDEYSSDPDQETSQSIDSALKNTFVLTEGYETLKTAMQEQAEAGRISAETYRALSEEIPDLYKYLELTADGYVLNADAVNEYIESQNEIVRSKATDRIIELQEALSDPTLSEFEIASIMDEIVQWQMLVKEIDSATGAYKRYLDAKDTPDKDTMFQTSVGMREYFEENLKLGKTGTDDFQAIVDFVLGETRSLYSSDAEAYKVAMDYLERYSGQETESDNYKNFFVDLAKSGIGKITEDGRYILDTQTSVEEIAEALGIGIDYVLAMMGLAESYGAEINTALISGYGEFDNTKSRGGTPIDYSKVGEMPVVDDTYYMPEVVDIPKTEVETAEAEVSWIGMVAETLEVVGKSATVTVDDADVRLSRKAQSKLDAQAAIKSQMDSIGYYEEKDGMPSIASQVLSGSDNPKVIAQAQRYWALDTANQYLESYDGVDLTLDRSSLMEDLREFEEVRQTLIDNGIDIPIGLEEDYNTLWNYVDSIATTLQGSEYSVGVSVDDNGEVRKLEKELDAATKDRTVKVNVNGGNSLTSLTSKLESLGNSLSKYASGTRHADDEVALVDEKGPELIEHVKRGTYELGTNEGPRFVQLDEGDIVHTAEETKRIRRRMAKVGSFFRSGLNKGKAVLGKAFAMGASNSSKNNYLTEGGTTQEKLEEKLDEITTIVGGINANLNPGSSSSSSSSKGSSSSGSSSSSLKKYLEKLFDWIEVRLAHLQRVTDNWLAAVNEAVGYVAKNAKLDSALSSVADQIEANTEGYTRYMQQAQEIADKAGFTAEQITLIQEGEIDIASYKTETQEKIKAYQEWYNKAIDCKDALVELREQERELATQKLDNILNHYQWRIDRLDSTIDLSEGRIDVKNATGVALKESDYDSAISAASKKIGELQASRNALKLELAKMVSSGYIKEGSEEWYEYTGEIEELDKTILETQVDLQDLIDAANNIALTNLQYALDALTQTASTLSQMMSLHSAQGLDATDTDYKELIENGMAQIENLKLQNAELIKQQQGLDKMSEKYQELQKEIDDNNQAILDMKISQEEWNDAVIDLEIAQLEKYKDQLSKTNDEYERQRNLQQAIEDLERARAQRTQRVYREGVGFVFEADQDAVLEAQQNLEQIIRDQLLDKMDDLIEALEDSKADTNVYDSNGVLLGKEYSLPVIDSYSELLAGTGSNSVITNAMTEVQKAIMQQILGGMGLGANGTSLQIGDIIVNGVETPDALAEAIVEQFPNAILQALYSK